jgi:nucleotide-binding universal stress UspA family protein
MAGGVGAQVVDAAPCAVAHAVAGLRERPDFQLRRVGVGFDGEAESARALAAAAELARGLGAELRILTVVESAVLMSTGSVGPAVYESIREALRQEAEKKVDHAVDSLEDLSVSRAILEGPIPASIVEESRRSSLDLLVVGSRRFGPLRRLLLGSVSRALMHSAPCSLVVVPRGGG